MINLEPQYLDIVKCILAEHVPECEVRVFGSRVTGNATKYSDLDIALFCDTKLDWRKLETLRDKFSESDLPISIDVLDGNAISDSFKAIIDESYVVIQQPTQCK